MKLLIVLIMTMVISGCGGRTVIHDFSTPEGAILCLEDAYRAKDLTAMVNCKDFRIEARLMFEKLKNVPVQAGDDELVNKAAEVLELAYRKEINDKGYPDMIGVTSSFPKTEPYKEGLVAVTEVCSYPDGGTSQQRVLVAKTDNGWRVLNPLD